MSTIAEVEITKVVFRKWKNGDITALFPEIRSGGGMYCLSYQHVGQHSESDYPYCVRDTVPAKPDEYAELQKELEGLGYKLKVMQKWSRPKLPKQRKLI